MTFFRAWASSLRGLATCRPGSARGRRFLEQSVADAGFCLASIPSLPATALFWPADAGRNPFQECHLSRLYHPALYDRDVPVGSYWEASAPPLARDTPPLTGAADCEVAVIGAGSTGLKIGRASGRERVCKHV